MKKNVKQHAVYAFLLVGRFGMNIVYFFHKLCPVKNRVSIVSRQGDTPYEDILMLADEIKKISPETEVVISCRNAGGGLKKKAGYVVHLFTKQMHIFATSRIVILDSYCISASMLRHRKNLKIVQMWHAMGALKRFGRTALDEEEGRNSAVANGMRMHKNYSVVFVSSEVCIEPMAASFGCEAEKMKVMPLPRTDILRNPSLLEKNKKRVYERYPQLEGKRVLLYTPTFRKNRGVSEYARRLIDAVNFETDALIIKLHPHDAEKIPPCSAILDKDFTSLEMLGAADCVITDYSAFLFEAAAAEKPVIRYTPDSKMYNAQRGFLIDIDNELPFFCSDSADEVIKAADEGRFDEEKERAFAEKYVAPGTGNTRRMAEYIMSLAGISSTAG